MAYTASCGNGGYAATYVLLGTPIVAGSEAFSSADLGRSATPQKSGYNFTLGAGAGSAAGPNDCNGTATQTAYYSSAVPQTFGTTGTSTGVGTTLGTTSAGSTGLTTSTSTGATTTFGTTGTSTGVGTTLGTTGTTFGTTSAGTTTGATGTTVIFGTTGTKQ